MRDKLNLIVLGCEVYGLSYEDIARKFGCSTRTVYRIRHGETVKPSTRRAVLEAVDKLAERGMMVLQAGARALEHIPAEHLDTDERNGYITSRRAEILAGL